MLKLFVKAFLAKIIFLTCSGQVLADVKVPDAGTILNEIPTEQFSKFESSKQIKSNVSESEYSSDTTPIMISKVVVSGNTVLKTSAIEEITSKYIHKTIYFADIQKMVDDITNAYVREGYFISRAYLPQQQIIDGTLKINIIEARIGDIKLNNDSRVKDELLEKFISDLKNNSPIKENFINRKILLINDLGGVVISNASIQAGKNSGTTDLNLDLMSDSLFDSKITLDNEGGTYTGQYRMSAIVSANGALGYGENFTGQFLSSDQDLLSSSLSIKFPILNDGLNFLLKYSTTQYSLGEQFKVLDASGLSNVYGFGLSYPFIRSQNLNLSFDSNYEHKRIFDEFAATDVRTLKNSDSLKFGIDLGWSDQFMSLSFSNFRTNYTLGSLNIKSPDALNIDSLSAKTDGTFAVLNMDFLRQQFLNNNLYLLFQMNGQLASKNLDSSEKFNFRSMRAYPSSEGLGDQGWNTSLDLNYKVSDNFKIYVFQDFAESWLNVEKYLFEKNNRYLASSGIGFSTSFKKFDVNTSLAWRNTSVAISDKDKNPRFLFQANWFF